jgi:hypothetical protein
MLATLGFLGGQSHADTWGGQTSPAPVIGSQGAWISFNGFQRQTMNWCAGSYYCGAGDFTTFPSVPNGIDGSTLGLYISGAYPDSNSPTGIAGLSGYVPLSAFARSSTVNALQQSFNAFQQSFNVFSHEVLDWQTQMRRAFDLQVRTTNSGVAQALAMAGTTDLQSDENFAVSINMGTFRGQTAIAGAGVARLSQHVSFNTGITAGVNGGAVGARAGVRFGW